MDEPQRGKRKGDRIDPYGDRNQHHKANREDHARGPDDAGRDADIAGDDAHQQQRPAVALQEGVAFGLAGMVSQRIHTHHAVGEPAPDDGRHNQHQRGDQPQRHRHDKGHDGHCRGAQGPEHTGHQAHAIFLLQKREALLGHHIDQRGRHQQCNHQQRNHRCHGRDQDQHHKGRDARCKTLGAAAAKPAEHRAQPANGLHPVLHGCDRARPEEIAPAPQSHQHHHQRQNG